MSHAAPIHPHHLNRKAVVYVRQSTAKQLVQHPESTRRQYQLAERAAGSAGRSPASRSLTTIWAAPAPIVAGREGFQRWLRRLAGGGRSGAGHRGLAAVPAQ